MFSDFIAATRAEPFVWGQNDCALWTASAVAHVTGFDPAADLRGTYASRFECRRLMIKAGGMVNLIAPRMARFEPIDGDGVAVVRVGNQTLCGLIIDGALVARSENGIAVMDEFDLLRGWRCHRY